ncbi:hypothetical protein SLS62_003545 [Diatrype stigma]|uniref:Uncharacterized protein n=1 Tax=Diatrype stigma TaxID=117547 RepID=A0AAN9UYC4_9PEZI
MEPQIPTHNPPPPAARKTIADHGLERIRILVEPQPGFVEPYLPRPSPQDWQHNEVCLPVGHPANNGHAHAFLNFYSYSRSHNAYVTNYVWLTEDEEVGSPRFTEMRYRDMTIDNIIAAGGRPEELRFLAIHHIINKAATKSISRVFELAGMRSDETGVVTIRPGDHIFEECRASNPFLRGHGRLLEHSEDPTGGAFIKQVIFISEGFDLLRPSIASMEEPGTMVHMITEFDRAAQP